MNIKENTKTGKYDTITVQTILAWFTAVATKVGSVIATVENVLCEVFRKKEVIEAYFRGQELYNIKDNTKNGVMRMKFGSTEWECLYP